MGKTPAEVAQSWTTLGERDAMWAALTEPKKSLGRWRPGEFLGTGAEEVTAMLNRVVDRGLAPKLGTALDFGCGPGRLTAALATAGFQSVIGVDISEPMLAKAAELVPDSRCRFIHNTGTQLAQVGNDSIDLVYTCRVLQHMPATLAHSYIREFFRVTRPGGIVVFQIPSEPLLSLAGTALRVLPRHVLTVLRRGMEMHGTPPTQVTELVADCGGRTVSIESDNSAGPRWRSYLYITEVGKA